MRSLEDILDSVLTATENSSLPWSHEGGDRFKVKLAKEHYLSLRTWYDRSNEANGISAELFDSGGQLIDEVNADQRSPKHEILSELLNKARRSAFKVDDVISTIEGELRLLNKRTID